MTKIKKQERITFTLEVARGNEINTESTSQILQLL